jgi:hypothetical protein
MAVRTFRAVCALGADIRLGVACAFGSCVRILLWATFRELGFGQAGSAPASPPATSATAPVIGEIVPRLMRGLADGARRHLGGACRMNGSRGWRGFFFDAIHFAFQFFAFFFLTLDFLLFHD